MTCQACQLFRQRIRSLEGRYSAFDDYPGLVCELHVFDVLGEVIQPAQQAERIPQGRNRSMPQARYYTQPGLLPDLYQDSVLDTLQVDRQRGLPAGGGASAGGDLDSHLILGSQNLGVHVAAVEFRH